MGASPAVQVFIELLSQDFPDLGGTCDDPEEARRMLRERPEIPLAPVELASVEDRAVPGPGGDVRVRVYSPAAANRNVVVYYHGGGWVIGDVDTHDRTTRRLARDTGATVVSVDYRCAPEHRFPAAADDAYAALVWAAEEYDPPKLAVAGDSAGGNLSAVVALMARDRGSPRIDHQLLVYPVTDCTFDTESYRENGTGEFFLSETHMRWFWDQYLGPDGDGGDPYASPLRAEDLSGLPPATVVTAELDPLRDEGEAYAAALAAAGVPVELHRANGMFHGFFGVDELLPEAAPSMAWTVERLRGAVA